MAEWWKDEKLVQQIYEEAEKENTAAQCEIARQLMQEGRMQEAVSWYKRAASNGETDAMFNLGMLYSNGWEKEDPSPEQAFFWYERAAASGDAEAMYMTGYNCLHGNGTEKNQKQAADWLKKALAAGYMAAQELLFTIPGMEEERRLQMQEIEKLSGQADGFLENQDYKAAVPLFEAAVEKSAKRLGETDAFTIGLMNNLAVCLSALEQYDKSIPLKERVLELRGKSLPLTHPDYLTAVTNLTSDYAKIGRYQSSLNLSKQAYIAARETLPASHEVTLLTLNRLSADYMNLCRHDLALEQLESVAKMMEEKEMQSALTKEAQTQWERTGRLLAICKEAVETSKVYFQLDESRRSYAYICAELCEMLNGLPDDYRRRIKQEEYDHFKEQADLVSCYHPHMNSGQAVETDPYTNALQTLVSLKYLMPSVAECREELDALSCRAVVTWIQNELCMIVTVYPAKSIVEHMEHPQPADFVKPLNAGIESGKKVMSFDSVDLRMRRLENGTVEICFAYGVDGTYRMLSMYYREDTNQLEGENGFHVLEG